MAAVLLPLSLLGDAGLAGLVERRFGEELPLFSVTPNQSMLGLRRGHGKKRDARQTCSTYAAEVGAVVDVVILD